MPLKTLTAMPMKTLALVLTFVLAPSAVVSAYAPARQEKPQDPAPASRPAKRSLTELEASELFAKAHKHYQAKEYQEALAAFESVAGAEGLPEAFRPNSLYNIACCHALLGHNDKAVEYVVKAIDAGFLEYEHIKKDEDLKAVIGDPKIAEAMKRNQSKKDEAEAEAKRRQAAMMKQMDEQQMKTLPDSLEKLKDVKGAGFEFSFNLKTIDGKEISSKSLLGRVVIVDIWGTWCPPCRYEIPHLVELAKKHEKAPFTLVGLTDEDRAQNKDPEAATKAVKAFAAENKINYPLALIDKPTIKQVPKFGGYPTTLLIDKTGKVRLKLVGYHPLEYFDALVKELVKEEIAK